MGRFERRRTLETVRRQSLSVNGLPSIFWPIVGGVHGEVPFSKTSSVVDSKSLYWSYVQSYVIKPLTVSAKLQNPRQTGALSRFSLDPIRGRWPVLFSGPLQRGGCFRYDSLARSRSALSLLSNPKVFFNIDYFCEPANRTAKRIPLLGPCHVGCHPPARLLIVFCHGPIGFQPPPYLIQ